MVHIQTIGQAGVEPATSWSRTKRATNCATARKQGPGSNPQSIFNATGVLLRKTPTPKPEVLATGATGLAFRAQCESSIRIPVCSLQAAFAPCRRHPAAFSFGGGYGSSPAKVLLATGVLPCKTPTPKPEVLATGATGLEPAISGLTGQRDKPASLRPQRCI